MAVVIHRTNREIPENPPAQGPEYVDERYLVALTSISARSWQHMRWQGDGPTFVKIGSRVRYHLPTVRVWLEQRQRQSTSAASR
jgi:hypothetical protein